MADEAGLEFLLPIGAGAATAKSDFQASLETITWATGILANTCSCTVFGTIHAPLFHPIIAAKQMATVDTFSRGGFGLNLVCGWNQDEFDMFGQEQREHDVRYDYGEEWLDVVRTVWREDDRVDYRRAFFDLGLVGRPKPYGGDEPVLMNAGYSPAGRAFAMRNCEFLLTSLIDVESGPAGRRGGARDGAAAGSTARYRAPGHGLRRLRARPRRGEEFHRHYAGDYADWEAADHLMELAGIHAQFFPPDHYQQFRELRRRARHVPDRRRSRSRRERAGPDRRRRVCRGRVLARRLPGRAAVLQGRGAAAPASSRPAPAAAVTRPLPADRPRRAPASGRVASRRSP